MSEILGFIKDVYENSEEIVRVWEIYYPGEPDEPEFLQRKHSMR